MPEEREKLNKELLGKKEPALDYLECFKPIQITKYEEMRKFIFGGKCAGERGPRCGWKMCCRRDCVGDSWVHSTISAEAWNRDGVIRGDSVKNSFA